MPQGQLWISQIKLILWCRDLVLLAESIMGNCRVISSQEAQIGSDCCDL